MTMRDTAQRQLVCLYREAIMAWRTAPPVREAAGRLGLTLRDYAERHVAFAGPLTWTATETGATLDADAAWAEAVGEENG